MKKNLILASLLAITSCLNATTGQGPYKQKSNGGLFGYKYVEETKMNNGQIFLACKDPGFTRCKSQMAIVIENDGNQVELSEEQLEIIDRTVMKFVMKDNTDGNSKGRFIYNDELYITYTYDVLNDDLQYQINLIAKAEEIGLLQ